MTGWDIARSEPVRVHTVPADDHRHVQGVSRIHDFAFECGHVLPYVDLGYESWGTLNSAGDNAVVICHALTGDAHAGPGGEKSGWWEDLIGPGKAIDTRRSFVVASNVLGGCSGSTGPSSIALDGHPYALRFPFVTVRDMVRAQIALAGALGIQRVKLVIGGSLGGMQAWEWPLLAPGRVDHAVVIAAHAAFPPLAIGYNEAMRQAIVMDPDWQAGSYYGTGRHPKAGLSTARTIGMLTYRSDPLYAQRFGRAPALQAADCASVWPNAYEAFTKPQFAVEQYLQHQGYKLDVRFDANSYLYLTRAMDSHDIGRGRGGIETALKSFGAKLTIVSIDTDYLYDGEALRRTAEKALQCGIDCRYEAIRSEFGHDAFLLEQQHIAQILRGGQSTLTG